MGSNIHNAIRNEYEKRQKLAFDSLMARKDEAYSKIPGLEEIETQIRFSGIKYNKIILLGNSSADEAVSRLLVEIDALKEERKGLLASAGYPENYLELAYQCFQCKDTGFITSSKGAERCACYKQQIINCLYNESNLKLTEKENFNSFNEGYYSKSANEQKYGIKISPRENIVRIKERCLKFLENFSSADEKNLFFSGPTGVGKTFMSNCIACELLNKGRTVLYQTAPMLFDIINEHKINTFKDESFEDESYKNVFEVELLIIDDLGTEPQSAAKFAELLNILNTRQINNLSRPCKTIISTNIEAKDLYKYYQERIASRIIGCFDMFRFAGDDIRSVKKLSGKQ